MYRKCNQAENGYTYLARKFFEEKNRTDIHAGMRLVYRIVKIYGGQATRSFVYQDVAKIVPMWMLAQNRVNVEGCLSSLIRGGFIEKTGEFYAVKTNATGAAAQKVAN